MLREPFEILLIIFVILLPLVFINFYRDGIDYDDSTGTCENICSPRNYVKTSLECYRNRNICRCENYPGDIEIIDYPGVNCDDR